MSLADWLLISINKHSAQRVTVRSSSTSLRETTDGSILAEGSGDTAIYRYSFENMDCAIARSLEILGEWWTLLIIREAFLGVRRFDDLQSNLGIARNVLTNRLATLVEHGILSRQQYQEKPPRFEYRLTEKGLDLYPILLALMKWGERWVGGKSATVLIHKSCGQRITAEFRCQHCNEIISARNIRPEFETVPAPEAVNQS